jgi:hypothetical protein
MKKPQPSDEPEAPGAPEPASTVLRQLFAPADKRDGTEGQHFVIRTLLPTLADTMQRAQPQERESQDGGEPARRPAAPAWEENSGEGAASALESLRKLEQSRRTNRPAEERPGAE